MLRCGVALSATEFTLNGCEGTPGTVFLKSAFASTLYVIISKMVVRFLLILSLLLVAFVVGAFANPIPHRDFDPDFRPKYGVSYSFEQAGWYGLDPKESYIELLDLFKFDWIRLPFFWDEMVDQSGNLLIENLKFAIEEASKRNVGVIIALGAKTPYFPEYHWPKEIRDQVRFGESITLNHPVADDILATSRQVVDTLAIYDNIIAWQVENEPLIGNVNKWKIDPALIAAEVEVVRQSDPRARPIILNHAATGFYDQSWKELLSILAPGDIFAVNAFFKTKGADLVTAKILGREIHILWPDHLVWPVHSWGFLSPDFRTIKERLESNGNRLWILEMQAEPYIKKLSQAQDPFLSFVPQDISAADHFLGSYEIESVGLWGAHFWQYRAKNGDDSWIETVRKMVNSK